MYVCQRDVYLNFGPTSQSFNIDICLQYARFTGY